MKLIPKYQRSGVIQPILVTPTKVGHDYTVYDNREMIPEGAKLSDEKRHKQEAKRGAIAVNRAQNAAAKPLLHLTANGLMFVPGGQLGMAAYGLANLYNKTQDGSFSNLRDNWNKRNYLNVAGTVGSTALDVAATIPAFNITNRAIDFGFARAGNNAARGRVIARTMGKPNMNNYIAEEVTPVIVQNNPKTVRLYRATRTSGSFTPSIDGTAEFTGLWFTDDPNKIKRYASYSTKRSLMHGEKNPVYIQYVDIPEDLLIKYKASNLLEGLRDVEFEPTEDYLIPLSMDRGSVEFKGLTGNLLKDTRLLLPYLPNYIHTSNPHVFLGHLQRPIKLTEAERLGIPKGERFVRPFRVASYPGYLLKSLMKGSQLERQLSKNGTISINLLNAHFNKASQTERDVINKVLTEKFNGLRIVDYNLLKKAVLDELITYNIKPLYEYSTYGMDRLGFQVKREPDGAGGILEYTPGINTKTFTFESSRIPYGNTKHYGGNPIGHSRTYTLPEESDILHVMESQSDWALKSLGLTKAEKTAIQNIDEQLKTLTPTGFSTLEELQVQKLAILDRASLRTQGSSYQALHLHDNYLQRQLQENLKFAAENGLTKMRYPTPETAAKIEGYLKKFNPHKKELSELRDKILELWTKYYDEHKSELLNVDFLLLDDIGRRNIQGFSDLRDLYEKLKNIPLQYAPEYQTILKKYADFPKLFLKLYKNLQVRTVTDSKGNTWFEVDVPKNYLHSEWLFKQGGILNAKSQTD